jgi:hypothetical protein
MSTEDLTALRESRAVRTEHERAWRVRELRALMRGDAPSPMPRPHDFTEDAEVLLRRELAALTTAEELRPALVEALAEYPPGNENDSRPLRKLFDDRRATVLGALRTLDEQPAKITRLLDRILGYTPENIGDSATFAIADNDWRDVRVCVGSAHSVAASLAEAAKLTPQIEERIAEELARERRGAGLPVPPPTTKGVNVEDALKPRKQTRAVRAAPEDE